MPESQSSFEVKFNSDADFDLFSKRWGSCKTHIDGLINRDATLTPNKSQRSYQVQLTMKVDCQTAFGNFQAAIRKEMNSIPGLTAELQGDRFTLLQLSCSKK